MKISIYNILKFKIQICITLLTCFLVLQPIFSSISSANNDFIELHDEKETSEKENLTENSKKEKNELQIVELDALLTFFNKKAKKYNVLGFLLPFTLKILIPPPELVVLPS